MLKIVDIFECDLRDIKSERKERFLRDSAAYSVGGVGRPLPELIVTVAATHAGLMTRNKAFYRPDIMKAHLESFLKPFAKPVQLHHSDHQDPVGRVRNVRYVDISQKYMAPLKDFKNRFKGTNFLDAAASTEKSFDQVNWILKNMQKMDGYQGLGYGELDLHITDKTTAEKILDERYLTVSVGFSTTEAYCSQCKQDWAGAEGRCDHTPGEMYDDVPMVLIPSNFLYEEVSWVNNPADPHAQVTKVLQTGSPALETVSAPVAQNHDSATLAILTCVTGEGIYRIDSFKDVEPTRAKEILAVTKQTDSNDDKVVPELIEVDGVQFPKEADSLLQDAKRVNYVTDAVSAGDIPQHSHRVVLDPVTGNGYSDYVTGHSHAVVNSVVQPNDCYGPMDTAEGEETSNPDEHTHKLAEKVAPLTDTVLDEVTDETCEKCAKKKKKMGVTYNATDEVCVCEETVVTDELEITDEILAMEDFYEKFIAPVLDELGAGDAKLSGAQRKSLKASTFCGPNRSFPVPDCAHVTAARRLIGRYKGDKKGILACVSRKAKALGCDKTKDAFEPIDVMLVSPVAGEKQITVRVSDKDDFQVVINTIGSDVFEANKDRLYEIGKLLDMTMEQVDTFVKSGKPHGETETQAPLEAVIANVENAFTSDHAEQFVDGLVTNLKALDDDTRTKAVEMLRDKLIAAGLLPDYDQEYNDLVEENENLKSKIAKLTKQARDLYVAKQELLAKTIVRLQESLKKPGFEGLDETARTLKVSEYTVRSIDSLNDTLRDVTDEITGAKATQPELDADATGQPGSLELEPETKPVRVEDKGAVPFDPKVLVDLPEDTYQLARRLQDSYRGDKR